MPEKTESNFNGDLLETFFGFGAKVYNKRQFHTVFFGVVKNHLGAEARLTNEELVPKIDSLFTSYSKAHQYAEKSKELPKSSSKNNILIKCLDEFGTAIKELFYQVMGDIHNLHAKAKLAIIAKQVDKSWTSQAMDFMQKNFFAKKEEGLPFYMQDVTTKHVGREKKRRKTALAKPEGHNIV